MFKDAEIVDFAAPYGVFSVARRFDPELDVFLIAEAMRPVQAQAGFTVVPNYAFNDRPAMNAFLIPGGFGTRQETRNGRLHEYIRALPETTLLTSVCTGSWIYGAMGLLDGKPATNRKEPDRLEASNFGKVPIDRLAEIAPAARISRARVVDAGRIVTAGGIASGMEMGFHLLRRAGYDEAFITDVARVMEYAAAYETYRGDIEYAVIKSTFTDETCDRMRLSKRAMTLALAVLLTPAGVWDLSFVASASAEPAALTKSQSDALNAYNKAAADFKAVLTQRRAQIDAKQKLPNLPGQALYLARLAMMSSYKDLTDALPSILGGRTSLGFLPRTSMPPTSR